MTNSATPVRPATTADIPALLALVDLGYRGIAGAPGWTHEAHLFDGPRSDAASLAAMIAEPGQVIFLHEDAGVIIACVLVATDGAGIAYLGLLCVDPRRQAAGLGRRMVAVAEDAAMRQGARTLEMTVIDARDDLIAWYQRHGYALTGNTRPLPPGVGTTRLPMALAVLSKSLAWPA